MRKYGKISIRANLHGWNMYGFYEKVNTDKNTGRGYVCSQVLYRQYVYIIKELQKAGLLPDDFKMKCCNHYGKYKTKYCDICGGMTRLVHHNIEQDLGYFCDNCRKILPDKPF